jgi:hypothetical protein
MIDVTIPYSSDNYISLSIEAVNNPSKKQLIHNIHKALNSLNDECKTEALKDFLHNLLSHC